MSAGPQLLLIGAVATGGVLAPDFKTIADFRKDNGKAIREVCRAFSFE